MQILKTNLVYIQLDDRLTLADTNVYSICTLINDKCHRLFTGSRVPC